MEYTWREFNLNEALSGVLVGKPVTAQVGGTESIDDISKVAGRLYDTSKAYKVVINGVTVHLSTTGAVVKSIPTGVYNVNDQFCLVSSTLTENVGTTIARTRGQVPGYENETELTNMQPRDTFAVQILSAMLAHAGNPVEFDDTTIMMYARASYRWAQAMMDVAADTRNGKPQSQSTTVDVNAADLVSNTEKILYNIADYMKNGVTIKPKTGEPLQTETKVKEMPTTTHVTVDNTPQVNVANSPTVTVSNMPSEPISVAVTSMPSST